MPSTIGKRVRGAEFSDQVNTHKKRNGVLFIFELFVLLCGWQMGTRLRLAGSFDLYSL